MKATGAPRIIRWLLTIALLYVVFRHAHWSVGLCLTLQAIAIEALVFVK